jgi:hypothetical protein
LDIFYIAITVSNPVKIKFFSDFPRPGFTASPAQQPFVHCLALVVAAVPALLLL